jgi:thiol:disulfide interchange protein
MKRLITTLFTAMMLTLATAAYAFADPFRPAATYADGVVTVTFTMLSPDQHIYDDMMMCSLGDALSKPTAHKDADDRDIYEGVATFTWAAQPSQSFTLDYQGCDAAQCYMPQTVTFTIQADGTVVDGDAAATPEAPAMNFSVPSFDVNLPTMEMPSMDVVPVEVPAVEVAPEAPTANERALSGFIPAETFIPFLKGETAEAAEAGAVSFFDDPRAWVAVHGFWFLIGLVFIFGIALNLTPCVLPMMPINLAIIGAGAAGGSRAKGALRGGAYGLGIALSYGILALIPVLTGAAFGTLQATWWFNAAIAIVFILLALALLDVFMIDFTRFSSGNSGKQGTLAAFIAGAVSAVLAGACVAPILIAVLLLTTDYVAAGSYWALCLPFVLGLGMAAPWPIAGAGLSFLPRPGAWMMWVKKIFAVIVFIFAAYYGWTAVKTFLPHEGLSGTDLPAIEAAIAEARAEGKPVLLDFWGPACKACDQMEASTLQDAKVLKELERFEVIKVRMDLADRAIRPAQERFNIQGLPTFIVID